MTMTMNSTVNGIPRILILGNGLNLAYGSRSVSWKNLITDGTDQNVPDTITVPLSAVAVITVLP